jgi:hypothetical protein
MCTGCNSTAKAATVSATGDTLAPPEPSNDTTEFTVAYFNGTTEHVRGLEEVRRRVIDPSSRAPGTDENGLQGATYAPRR